LDLAVDNGSIEVNSMIWSHEPDLRVE